MWGPGRADRRDRLRSSHGHHADLATHSGSVPRRQLPLSHLLRPVPTGQTRPVRRPKVCSSMKNVPSLDVPFIDVRGPRFAAWVTSAVLALALVSGSGWLVAA